MPAGPEALGLVYFAAVKAVGYTAASVVLKRGYGLHKIPKPRVWNVGLTRTGIGIVAGALYGVTWLYGARIVIGSHPISYYALLLPIRLAEWCFLIWIFFDRSLHDRHRMWIYAIFGTVCSYVLDAVGVFAAFVLPGGFWIC
jgi:hypothetical protein